MSDPAVLFYTSDFLTGVIDMTMEERGQYITLLCYQHQKGHIKEETIRLLVGYPSDMVMKHFIKDEEEKFYNRRMDLEKEKREHFVESRRENGIKGGRPNIQKEKPSGKPSGKPKKNLMGNDNDNDNIIKYGSYKRVLLTNKQYNNLIEEFGKELIDTKIEKLDEYVQLNDNKNKYKDFNLVIRKSIKENWFKGKEIKKYSEEWWDQLGNDK